MSDFDEAAKINKFLKGFGINQIDTKQPMFRLVWAPDQRELRRGEFNVYAGEIFIRTEVGVREMPKYPYIGERYVLEQWYPPVLSYSEELPNSKYGSYEPLYVFEDKNRNKLPLNIKVVEMIMYAKFNDRQSPDQRKSRLATEEDEKDQKETKYFEEVIDTSDITSLLHFKEAILCPDIGVPSQNLRGNNDSTENSN